MKPLRQYLRYYFNVNPHTIQGRLTIGFLSLVLISFFIILLAGHTWQHTHTNWDKMYTVIGLSERAFYQLEATLSQTETALLRRVLTEGSFADTTRQALWRQTFTLQLQTLEALVGQWEDPEAAQRVANLRTALQQFRTTQDQMATQCRPDNPPALFKEMWTTIKAGGIFRGQLPNRAKDGSTYWVDATIAPVLDESGKPLKYIGIRFDITAQKQQEAELRRLLASSPKAV